MKPKRTPAVKKLVSSRPFRVRCYFIKICFVSGRRLEGGRGRTDGHDFIQRTLTVSTLTETASEVSAHKWKAGSAAFHSLLFLCFCYVFIFTCLFYDAFQELRVQDHVASNDRVTTEL
jgi:hypothetical protein